MSRCFPHIEQTTFVTGFISNFTEDTREILHSDSFSRYLRWQFKRNAFKVSLNAMSSSE